MKIVTWNVNSIRTRLERTLALLERHAPDLLCLQELKVEDDKFPHDAFAEAGYRAWTHGQKSYNGVALIAPEDVDVTEVKRGFPGDPIPEEARVIGGSLPDGDGTLRVINLYVVNGKAPDTPSYETKLQWLRGIEAWLEDAHDPSDSLLLVGDFNVAPDDRDVHDPERWKGKIHATEPERERIRALFDWGLEDLQRCLTDESGIYTWWDYRMGAFHRGWGLRIDLALGMKSVASRVREVTVERDERKPTFGPGKPSDHAPVIVELE